MRIGRAHCAARVHKLCTGAQRLNRLARWRVAGQRQYGAHACRTTIPVSTPGNLRRRLATHVWTCVREDSRDQWSRRLRQWIVLRSPRSDAWAGRRLHQEVRLEANFARGAGGQHSGWRNADLSERSAARQRVYVAPRDQPHRSIGGRGRSLGDPEGARIAQPEGGAGVDHNLRTATLCCRSKIEVSGFSKVEMSGSRYARPHVFGTSEHEPSGTRPGGVDAPDPRASAHPAQGG